MTIYSGSRYEYSTVAYTGLNPAESTSKFPVLFYYFDDIGTITYREYEWKEGDRLDSVAQSMYMNPQLWWIIAEHNPEIKDPSNIPPGTLLRIPNA